MLIKQRQKANPWKAPALYLFASLPTHQESFLQLDAISFFRLHIELFKHSL